MKTTFLFVSMVSSIFLLAGCVQKPVTPPVTPPIVEQTTQVSLYYHNLTEDQKMYEWISFNEEFFLPVLRTLPVSETLITDTFTLLFAADLTEAEKATWLSAWLFDTYDFTIQNISFTGGILSIIFVDDAFLMSLASAEQGILTTSLVKTAEQFPEIQQIILHEEMKIAIE
jgi:hypothetical protein